MIAALAKMIEWACVQRCFRRMPHPDGQDLRLDEAIQFLNGSDFMPPESQPAEVVFDKRSTFHFGTPLPGPFAENNVVYGHLYRCSERWRERPTIILLHGRADSTNYRITFPKVAPGCKRVEWNAATLVLPYHPNIWRLPHGHVSWMLTPGVYRRTLEWLAPRLEKPDKDARFRAVQGIAPAETHS